jgi:hypothetical protein
VSEPAAHTGRSVSRLEAASERRAARLGKSVEQLLSDDRVALRQPTYPGPECLSPYEIEQFFGTDDLREDRVAHVDACPMCAALLDTARPTDSALAQFMDEYRHAKAAEQLAEASTELAISSIRRPLIDVLSVVVPIVVAVIAVAAIGIGMIGDTIMANLLSTIAVRSVVKVTVGALIISLMAVAAAKWLKAGQRASFQRFGGAAFGGVFAALLVPYGAKLSLDVSSAYSSLKTAQNALLTALAERQGTASTMAILLANEGALKVTSSSDGKLLSATSERFAGKVIARERQNSIDVSWDTLGKSRKLGTIYHGILEHRADGEVDIVTGNKKIGVGGTSRNRRSAAAPAYLRWCPHILPRHRRSCRST